MNEATKTGRTEEFAFDLGCNVMIREIQRPGRIVGLLVDYLGPQYEVAYWDEGERQSAWLTVDELEAKA